MSTIYQIEGAMSRLAEYSPYLEFLQEHQYEEEWEELFRITSKSIKKRVIRLLELLEENEPVIEEINHEDLSSIKTYHLTSDSSPSDKDT